MSFTQTQIDNLRAAVAAGVRTVTTDGNSVTYASTDEMLRVIGVMERAVSTSTTRYSNPYYQKGV